MGIDTDGHLAQCEHVRDYAEEELERAYDMGVRNQADWLTRNRDAIERLLSDYEADVKSGIDADAEDAVFFALDHPFDLPALRGFGMRIGG
jgi:hypothetical protein